jgi:hypothetical protein
MTRVPAREMRWIMREPERTWTEQSIEKGTWSRGAILGLVPRIYRRFRKILTEFNIFEDRQILGTSPRIVCCC